jgi:hypothetical protein
MRHVTYAGGKFVTNDEVAEALLEYAAALANANRAATVHVPGVDEWGAPSDIQVLIGPASQVMATAAAGDDTDVDGATFVSTVTERMTVLRRTFIPGDGESSDTWDI